MKYFFLAFGIFLLSCSSLAFSRDVCGTAQLMQHLREQGKSVHSLLSDKPLARTTTSACTDDDYYDSVYSRTTNHFEIFYTLDGPHKTIPEFIDSLAKHLEYAWDFHVNKQGMLPPLGISESYHYQQKVQKGLYAIEVIDIDLLRDTKVILDGSCHKCFALTLPFDSTQSEIFIDNDFRYIPVKNQTKDTVHYNGKNCSYPRATEELLNTAHNYSYVEQWNKGLQVTTAHELYHSSQLRYLDMLLYFNFWFEASASGIEEIVAPDVDDYFSYLPAMSKIVGTPLDRMTQDYAAGLLLLYLYNHVDPRTDKSIWESYAKNPSESFQYQLSQAVKKKKLSPDSLFNDFATRLSFAGKRSTMVDSSFWIASDQPNWPDFSSLSKSGTFEADQLDMLAYRFYIGGKPDLTKFTGKASAATLSNNLYKIHFLPTSNSVDSINIKNFGNINSDSTLWILSRFSEIDRIPTVVQDSTLKAYPTPWRHGNLCFTPLPQNKEFIEIRNRRGNLVSKIRYDQITHCLNESEVKSLMVPGVYRFRVGNKGKLKDFIIVY